jgi:winged helix DNA-binding protein
VDDIGSALDGKPVTREELIALVGHGRSEHVKSILRSGWGGMLKPAARNGRLCFGPSRGQSVTFVNPRQWLGWWHDVDPDQAIVEMARRYLRIYGPSTRNDFARWWGTWPGVGAAAWSALAPELVAVSVEGKRLDALSEDVAAMKRATITEPVQLLPLFDPYLMGHATRDHMVGRANLARVSRVAGWISAVVLVEGIVAGTWTHSFANKTLRIEIEPFSRLPARVKAGAKERGGEIARALGASKLEVSVD